MCQSWKGVRTSGHYGTVEIKFIWGGGGGGLCGCIRWYGLSGILACLSYRNSCTFFYLFLLNIQIIEDILVRCCLITTISRGRDITQIQQVNLLISSSCTNCYFRLASSCLIGSGTNLLPIRFQIADFLRLFNIQILYNFLLEVINFFYTEKFKVTL